MKGLSDLVDDDEPAWPTVEGWINKTACPVEVLPVVGHQGAEALVGLQITTRSPLGAIVYRTGGILVDHGWLRILGSGHPRLPRTVPGWTAERVTVKACERPPYVLIADDVVGGIFAIDGGALGFKTGEVVYFPPDTLAWESLDRSYTQFVQWSLSGELAGFYEDYRWPVWEREVAALSGDLSYSIYPPPCFKGEPISRRSRRAVPLSELYSYYQDLARQIANLPDGAQIRFTPLSDEQQDL